MPYKDKEKGKEYHKQYRIDNRERRREYNKKWRKDNPEKAKESNYLRCKKNPERIKEIEKRYREKNRDRIRERDKLYCKNNPEKMKEKRRKYSEGFKIWEKNNPDYNKIWRKNNLEYIKDYNKQWNQSLKGKLSNREKISKRRHLGFIPLNKPLKGYEGHHISENFVIFIPKELHKSIWHNIWTWKGMKKMNKLAIEYLE